MIMILSQREGCNFKGPLTTTKEIIEELENKIVKF